MKITDVENPVRVDVDGARWMVDPPDGNRYGFPAVMRQDYTLQLLQHGVPIDHIGLCLKYSRQWQLIE